jgi:MFS family permease
MRTPDALSPLRHQPFRIYAAGQAVSLTGTWMQTMATGWLVTGLSASASTLGYLNLLTWLPTLLLSLHAGVVADRFDKRRILIATQIALMLNAFAFAALVYTHSLTLWRVFALAVAGAMVTAYELPASQALPPELVPPREIARAVAIMQQAFHGTRLVGPALAGVLMARVGDFAAFVANGVSFIAVIGSLLVIRERPLRGDVEHGQAKPRGGIREGIAYLRGEPLVRALTMLAALTAGLVFPFVSILVPYYVRHVLGRDDAAALGLAMSVAGLGALAGTIALLWGSVASRRYWMLAGTLGGATALIGLALKPPLGGVLALYLLLSLSLSSLLGRVAQSVQERVPDSLRGRVMAVFGMSFNVVMPLVSFLMSLLADRAGYPLVMEVAASAFAVVGALLLRSAWRAFVAGPLPEPTRTR